MWRNEYSYDEAITKFIEEYLEMPVMWYKIKDGKKVLLPMYIHVALSVLIAHNIFTLAELKKEFYVEYGMVLYYNTDNLEY